jgi:SAM-dependent methyltransferase
VTNADAETVQGFGDEWSRFDWSGVGEAEVRRSFDLYFRFFPWDSLPQGAEGFDLGCGSGRWAKLAAPRVGKLHCIDASAAALEVARRNLRGVESCELHHASVDAIPLADGSMEFGYSLGVLHHIPDTRAALAACVKKLKPGAPFLVYLYYAFDNRPAWFRKVWQLSELGRQVISRLPPRARFVAADLIALGVYLPLSRASLVLEGAGVDVLSVPLSAYRHASFYALRTDALDRFGTRLEQRFTKTEVAEMMKAAGLVDVFVGDDFPYWTAVGRKAG